MCFSSRIDLFLSFASAVLKVMILVNNRTRTMNHCYFRPKPFCHFGINVAGFDTQRALIFDPLCHCCVLLELFQGLLVSWGKKTETTNLKGILLCTPR